MDRFRNVTMVVEVPKGGMRKPRANGRTDFWSPIPCPFNYGFIPGSLAPDGDPQDALLLGPRKPRGQRIDTYVVGRVRFHDAGKQDDKLVCSQSSIRRIDRWTIKIFFTVYAVAKGLLNRFRGEKPDTRFSGLVETP